MLDKVIHFSIHNKFIIGIITLVLVLAGYYSVSTLPIDALPDITNNQVQIITSSPTLATQEVEQFITYPVEQSVKTIPNIVELRSISRFGLSVVTVVFTEDTDVYWARAQISERIKEAENQIPKQFGVPEMAPVSTGLGEIYQYIVYPEEGYEEQYNATELRTIQDWIIKPQLTGTPGVAEVNTLGGMLKQYEIAVEPERLRSMDVTLPEIFDALESNNENTGGAYIDKKPYAYFIRGVGMVSSIPDIEKIVIKNKGGVPVLVRDVATVQIGSSIRYGAVTKDGKGEEVGGMVMMLKDANSSEVTDLVKQKIEQIKKSLPKGVAIEPFLDRDKMVGSAINTVKNNLIEGALIVIFILVLLLGNWRAGLVVASVIPLALLFAICMMRLFDISGNLMSLGAIDFGIIVDGAVIIVEAIIHRLEQSKKAKLTQNQMNVEVFQAASTIRSSAAFGEIIILIVYLPILALTGTEGKMFGPMAFTVSFAILGAFILSLTYVPMMSALFLKKETGKSFTFSDKIINFVYKIYQPLLNGALRIKFAVIALSVALFIAALFIFNSFGGEFIPQLDEGDIATHLIISTGSSLSQEIESTTKAEELLRKNFPEIKMVVSKIGAAEIPTDPMPIEAADMMIILKDKDQWRPGWTKERLVEEMEETLNQIPGAITEFSQPVQMRFNELMTGIRSDVAVKIYGEDLDMLVGKGDEALQLINQVDGVSDARAERVAGLPQITVRYNKDRLAAYGLNTGDINRMIRMGFAGESAGLVYEGERRFDLVVRLAESSRQDINNIKALYVPLPSGGQVPLGQVAEIDYEEGPVQISRDDGRRRIVVGFNVRGRDIQSVVKDIQDKLDTSLNLPSGYYITYGGQFENLIAAKERLSLALPAALLLIFILLYFTFKSIRQSLLIFTAIPLAAIGGVFALWFRGMPFSISAGVGFIALFGVAVLNGIVLIACFNRLKQEGMQDIEDRIREGTKVRLRPVLLTALVASLGFLPMALSTGAGAEVQKPLATVVIGGLVTATLLTLIVLPVLYYYFEKGIRFNQKAIAVMVIGLLVCSSVKVQAQQPLTLQDAIALGIKNNGSVKASHVEVTRQEQLRATAFDINKTQLNASFGQLNTYAQDKNISVFQTFSPFVYGAKRKLLTENINESRLNAAVTQQQITYSIRQGWNNLLYYSGLNRVLQEQNGYMEKFARSASLKFETGETGNLESITAMAKYQELQQQIKQNETLIRIEKSKLNTLLGLQGDFIIADTAFVPLPFFMEADSTMVKQNANLQLALQQVKTAHANRRAEGAALWPDVSAGYFMQSIKGPQEVNGETRYYDSALRFQGVTVGITIPVFAGSQAAKIKAAKINEQVQQLNAQYLEEQLQNQYVQQVAQCETYRELIEYYNDTALPNANTIAGNASKSYHNGYISYTEYVQGLEAAFTIKKNYLDALNNYNQSVINLQYLINQ
ncbi:CusA/CzcA family heavy metal efflux RND transporter [Flavobacterium rhizosphaerae]|uniref:CusA/CzcA family heavy metal efflux RND transporter n=1 Tax=Flavobacterium rhizosphaerae TaxID=3163298 RepID=A0ABW8YS71_9FLAO